MIGSLISAAGLTALVATAGLGVAHAGARAPATPNLPTDVLSWYAPAASEGRVSLEEAIRKVRRRYGDVTILNARTRNGGKVHRIKFLTESGRVRTVRVDARSGEFR